MKKSTRTNVVKETTRTIAANQHTYSDNGGMENTVRPWKKKEKRFEILFVVSPNQRRRIQKINCLHNTIAVAVDAIVELLCSSAYIYIANTL